MFLATHMIKCAVVRRRPRKEEPYCKRDTVYKYYFSTTEVCKEMFLATLGFATDKVLTVFRSSSTVKDQRGQTPAGKRGNNRKNVTVVQIDQIKKHINSFGPGISHYRRKHAPKRLYLDPSLTIRDMFNDYKSQTADSLSYISYYRLESKH